MTFALYSAQVIARLPKMQKSSHRLAIAKSSFTKNSSPSSDFPHSHERRYEKRESNASAHTK